MKQQGLKKQGLKLLLSATLALFVGAALAQEAEDFSYEATGQKDYSGVTLNILTHAVPVMGEPTALHAQQFSELTGARVNVVHSPFGDLFQRMMIPFQTGQCAFDVVFYGSYWIGDVQRFLEPLPERVLASEQFQSVTANYQDVATWEGQIVQFPVDGDRHYLKYRTDVLDDPEMQERYEEATGNELRAPRTWKEYGEIAAFFNGEEVDGRTLYGSAEVTQRDDLMFSAFISRAAPYAKHPEVGGGFFFDLETMTPLVNTPGFVEALSDMVEAQGYWPPGGSNFGLSDEIFSFGGGETLFSYSWDDAYVQALQEDSPIRESVAAAPLPGSERVWNRDQEAWDEFPDVNYAPYITWGWTSAVTACSPNHDAAFDYLGFFSNPQNTQSDLTIGRFGVNPYRTSHFDVDFWVDEAGWPEGAASSYTETLETYEASTNRVFDLRIPGVNEYMTALAAGVAQAIAGQQEPQAALDEVAAQWTVITERYGVDEQRRAYANIVQLEDNLRELPLFSE